MNFQNISVLLKIGKVYEVETFFIEKCREFPFKSFINISGTKKK